MKNKKDLCETCKKCGELTCGNDTINYLCFEPFVKNTINIKYGYEYARDLIIAELNEENIDGCPFTVKDVTALEKILNKVQKRYNINNDIAIIESNDVQDYLSNLSATYKLKNNKKNNFKK